MNSSSNFDTFEQMKYITFSSIGCCTTCVKGPLEYIEATLWILYPAHDCAIYSDISEQDETYHWILDLQPTAEEPVHYISDERGDIEHRHNKAIKAA
jgi:hypothetical protein